MANGVKRKVNRIKKGKAAEDAAKSLLEKEGWVVDQRCRVRFQNNDYFNLFDLVAIRGSAVRFIQVKTNKSHYYKARKEIVEWLAINGIVIMPEVWLLLFDKEGKPTGWRKCIFFRGFATDKRIVMLEALVGLDERDNSITDYDVMKPTVVREEIEL